MKINHIYGFILFWTAFCCAMEQSKEQASYLKLKLATKDAAQYILFSIPSYQQQTEDMLGHFHFIVAYNKQAEHPILDLFIRTADNKAQISSLQCPLLPETTACTTFCFAKIWYTASLEPKFR